MAAVPAPLAAQVLEIDLGRMSRMLDVRYYIAEHGELPPQYVLLGDVSFRPAFLEADFDLRREFVEFDDETGLIFRFRVPGQYAFVRREERRDLFYYIVPRDIAIPDLSVSIETFDERFARVRELSTRAAWVEDVRYNLSRERVEKAGRGLLSLDIPIALPKSIERIIGRGEQTNLTVQGSERIAIRGTSNWCSNCPRTEGQPRQEVFPDLDLEQQLNVSLRGTIGEKINVEIQHSSVGQGVPATNRVRLNYRGFDDDVIKLIEMGDTDLSLQGAQLVSYSGAAKGLFGVKTMAQAGPLDLTVIASKEEGESVSGTYSQTGGQSSRLDIRDIDYIKRQFFYFDNPGPDFMNPRQGFFSIFPAVGGLQGDSVEVFASIRSDEIKGEFEYRIDAWVDEYNNGLADTVTVDKHVLRGNTFRQLFEGRDYELIRLYSATGAVKYVGIQLARPLDNRNLVVRYKAKDRNGNDLFTVGDYGNFVREPFVAELICPDYNLFDPSKAKDPTWNLMMRNVYSLGISGISGDNINVRIEDRENRDNRHIHPGSGISYLRLFGLDRFDRTGAPRKDDIIDNLPGILDPERGYLQFPWFEPFNPPSQIFFDQNILDPPILDIADPREAGFQHATLERDTLLYLKMLTGPESDNNHNYNIVVEATSGRRNIQLAAYDIIEGSEVVTVNGARLVRGTDYDIDYTSGEVTIKANVPPDSRIMIDYQHKPLIGGGRNSLLGVGANLNLSANSRISGVFLYNSMGAPKYAPRLGEEPSRTMAADINASFIFNPRWMTTLANLLPRVDTNNQSTLNVSGEIAMSIPNPNVKGEAIIDDMEGVAESNQVSMLRRTWFPASPPFDADELYRRPEDRAEFYWYNAARTPQQEYFITSRRDLNPELDPRENSTVTTLFFDAINAQAGQWGGVMTGFPNGLDLSTAQYLEIWVNDFQTNAAARGGTVHIDFGRIDEDFYKPDAASIYPDDEDKAPPPWTIEEDIGFDADDGNCGYPMVFDQTTWVADKYVYRGINCRKGNQIRDTEDLNANGRLDKTNAYFSIVFDLADSALIDIRRDFPPDDPQGRWNEYWREKNLNISKAWRKYRIDLSRALPVFSAPSLENIQFVRIWIEGCDEIVPDVTNVKWGQARLVEFAEFQFVGSRWEYDGVRDFDGKALPDSSVAQTGQKLVVGTINNKDDPARYRPPYRVIQEEGITNREQSLTFKYENFEPSTAFRVVKRFFGDGQNYQQYQDFQFFLYPEAVGDSLGFYLQLATDENNYYELEVPLTIDDEGRWYWVNVQFTDLTNLKIAGGGSIVESVIRDAVDGSRFYGARVKGNPSLFRIRYLYAGLRNRTGGRIDRGEVWFNDIRVGGVRRDIDHAERMNFNADFAGVLQLVGGWQQTGAEFRSLRQSRGEGYETGSMSLSGKTEINHFIPTARFTLPVNFTLLRTNSLPKYVPNSDIEIADPAVRDSLKNVTENYGFTISLGRRGSTNFIMRNLFDNLRASYGYSRKNVLTPTLRDTSTTMSGGVGYQLQFRKAREIGLFGGVKWRWWLSNLTYEGNVGTSYAKSYTFAGGELVRRPTGRVGSWTNNVTTLYEPFQSVKINFALSEKRDLASENTFLGMPFGVETAWGHSLNLNYQPGPGIFLLSEFNPRFEFRSRYAEDSNPNLRQVREIRRDTVVTYPPGGPPDTTIVETMVRDPAGTRSASASRDIGITLDFDLGKYMNRLGQMLHLVEGGPARKRLPRASSTAGRARSREEILKLIEEQKQPQLSDDAGKITADEEEGAPPPGTPPPPPPTEGEEKPEKGGIKDLGISRPREGVPPAEPARPDTAGAAPAADTLAAPGDTARARAYDPLLPVKKAFTLLGSIEPVRTNISMSHQSRYDRIYQRAGALYQLGLSDAAGAAGPSSAREDEPLESRNSVSVDLNSGLALTQDIGLDIRARFSVSESDRQGKKSTSSQHNWPTITLDWRGIEKVGFIGRYVRRSDIKVAYDRRTTEDQVGGSNSYSITPNWNLDWKNRLTSNIGLTYRKSTTERNNRETWEKSYGVNVNLKYDIEGSKGLGLPLPFLSDKKLSFKSTLTTNLGITYGSTVAFNRPKGSSLGVTPSMSYRFSNSINGSLGVSYNRNWGGQYGYVQQQLAVRVEAEFRF